ncbi:hypothetical protein F4804DRAFT_323822 [Jackrogersella minutella]|nr:hypothetical protein F4804DRAFT_323822 [Jackrogersella minutella]
MDLPPAPNGLSNRWNLGLHWGICSGPNCHIRENLLKCGACKAILYCGADHQRADRPRHKSSCKLVKEARETLAREEAALRARPGDQFLMDNPFEAGRGRFWKLIPTRDYMQSRFDLTSTLLNIRTGDAVEAALEHSLEMLQLNRSDNQGVRSQVPALYLRLGRDQEAYDMIKWHSTFGAASDYDWNNLDLPYMNLHDEDVFEPPDSFVKNVENLSFLVCLTNLKVRLLLDIRMLANEAKKRGNINASYEKKMEWVREHAHSDVLYKRRDIVERTKWDDLLGSLQSQVRKLYAQVKKENRFYWPALKEPERWSAAYPTIYSVGSPHEVNLVFRNTWYSWAECPPALEMILAMR